MNNSSSFPIPETQNDYWWLHLYDCMTPAEKRISSVFCIMFKAFKKGDQKTLFWSESTIALRAKCSVKTVGRFIAKYKGVIFDSPKQLKKKCIDGHVKYFSNRYVLNEQFFTLLFFLKMKGYAKYWHIHRCRLMTKALESEWVGLSGIGYKFEVINKQMSDGECVKCPTKDLRNSSNSSEDIVPTKELSVPSSSISKKSASEWIKVPGLTAKGISFLDRFGSYYLVKEINNDYEFNVKKGNEIRYPDQWVKSRLCAQMKQQYKILQGLAYNG